MDCFVCVIVFLSIPYLIISCVEVGSNDATNLVNPILGAKILSRKYAVIIAGLFVVVGASSSSSVVDTVRKGIFDVTQLDAHMSVSIFITHRAVLVYEPITCNSDRLKDSTHGDPLACRNTCDANSNVNGTANLSLWDCGEPRKTQKPSQNMLLSSAR